MAGEPVDYVPSEQTATVECGAQPRASPPNLGSLHVGCAGWSYPHWRNKFYPQNVRPEHELQYYQQRFNACEINFTFHQMPTIDRCDKWRRSSPPGFLLSLKAPKTLTHISPLCTENLPQWTHFISAAKALGDRLGPILIQLPPSFAIDLQRLRALQPLLSREAGVKAAFEFRHNSWFCDDVYDVMRQSNWALVKHAVPSAGICEQWDVATSDWVYVRLHGKKDEHVWDYSSEELQPYAARVAALRTQGHACFIFFLNDADARAAANATAFFKIVRRTAGEQWEGLLGAGAGGACVLKGMFGKQQQQQGLHGQSMSPYHSNLTECFTPLKVPINPPLPPPSKASEASVKGAGGGAGLMRFFSRQPPPTLEASSPAKKLRGEDGPLPAAATANCEKHLGAWECLPPAEVVAVRERDGVDVIILD